VADPKAKTIVAAVIASLETITGQYAPDKVVRWVGFDSRVLDPSHATIISVSPDTRADERLTFGTLNNVQVTLPLDLALCRKFDAVEDPFNAPTQDRWDLQEEMCRVVKDKLRADRTFGALILDSEFLATDMNADTTFVEGWAITFLRLNMQFLHSEVTS
jgi:hypothetical protein